MYKTDTVERTLDPDYIPNYLRHAQAAELSQIKQTLLEISKQKKAKLRILDIGVGKARVPLLLSKDADIWERIGFYEGIDNSQACVESAKKITTENGIADKVKIELREAKKIAGLTETYDIILCTYFTAGNFYPSGFSFETDQTVKGKIQTAPTLEENGSFREVFLPAYRSLNPRGELVLGSVYIDNEETRRKQEEFYKKCGMNVITGPEHTFTATKEGFWSQRFTTEKILAYFDFVKPELIRFVSLDKEDFAMMVRIKKV